MPAGAAGWWVIWRRSEAMRLQRLGEFGSCACRYRSRARGGQHCQAEVGGLAGPDGGRPIWACAHCGWHLCSDEVPDQLLVHLLHLLHHHHRRRLDAERASRASRCQALSARSGREGGRWLSGAGCAPTLPGRQSRPAWFSTMRRFFAAFAARQDAMGAGR